ncbi:MAG: hypothetical protein VKJ06_01695 [Vampirovibrionales bacterium]|nr:hypothetical protein [Vampirovibrionales bacterium]
MTEAEFTERCLELFKLVQAQAPQKGVKSLLQRAHALAKVQNMSLSEALVQTYAGAERRTHARLALLSRFGQCTL